MYNWVVSSTIVSNGRNSTDYTLLILLYPAFDTYVRNIGAVRSGFSDHTTDTAFSVSYLEMDVLLR